MIISTGELPFERKGLINYNLFAVRVDPSSIETLVETLDRIASDQVKVSNMQKMIGIVATAFDWYSTDSRNTVDLIMCELAIRLPVAKASIALKALACTHALNDQQSLEINAHI